MAGNWLGVLPGWSVSPANGPGAQGSRYVIKGPSGKRLVSVGRGRSELLDLTKELHAMGLLRSGAPLDEEIPAGLLPDGVTERPQRQCRACSRVLGLERYSGTARTCKGCTLKLCRGPRAELRPCPACHEQRAGASLVDVPGLGLACPVCATEAREAAARAAEVVLLTRHEPAPVRLLGPVSSPAEDDAWFEAMDLASAAFGGPTLAPEPTEVAPSPAPPPEPEPPTVPAPVAVRLPQVRDFGRLRLLLELVSSGITSTRALGEAMGSKRCSARNAAFYRTAGEILGLLDGRAWTVTALGRRFLAASAGGDEERVILREAIAGAAALGPLVEAVLVTRAPDVEAVVQQVTALLPKLSRSTIVRRVRDTLSWRAALGLEPVSKRPSASPTVQLALWVSAEPPIERAPLRGVALLDAPRVTSQALLFPRSA